jgi:ribosome recycling factor
MVQSVLNELKEKIKKTAGVYQENLSTIRAGRANPALVEKITIDYYGTETPLNQVSSISVPEARLLVIQPWDATLISNIEKAILKSDLGITPSNDGKVVRLPFPALTEERRKDLVKLVNKMSEESKVAVRNSRRDAIDRVKKMEKNSDISEDQLKKAEVDIQKIVDDGIKNVDEITKKKEQELLEI